MSVTPQKLVHGEIQALSAYKVSNSHGMIKLDAMESPYGFDSTLKEQWLAHLATLDVNRYPDPGAQLLKHRLRKVFDIPEHIGLTLGNGSDELLQLIQIAVGGYGRCIMAPQPSFVMYEIIARYTRARFVALPLDERFELQRDKVLAACELENPACVFFSYPNNPSGNFFDSSLIEEVARTINGVVVVDEAYYAYSGRTMLASIERLANLMVVRTLSKSSLAGLRIGYLASQPSWAAEFEKLRLPYNIGVLAQVSATFALDHWEELEAGTERIRRARDSMTDQLKRISGLSVFPSEANFITFRVNGKDAPFVFDSLKRSEILVKNLDGSHPLLLNCLRVTIGTAEENQALLNALRSILGN